MNAGGRSREEDSHCGSNKGEDEKKGGKRQSMSDKKNTPEKQGKDTININEQMRNKQESGTQC